MTDNKRRGLYEKFHIERTDGKSAPGEKHDGCDYFVLDVTHDEYARAALKAYAASCAADYPQLAKDIRAKIRKRWGVQLSGSEPTPGRPNT